MRVETADSLIFVMAIELPRASEGEELTDSDTLASHAEKLIRRVPPMNRSDGRRP